MNEQLIKERNERKKARHKPLKLVLCLTVSHKLVMCACDENISSTHIFILS